MFLNVSAVFAKVSGDLPAIAMAVPSAAND